MHRLLFILLLLPVIAHAKTARTTADTATARIPHLHFLENKGQVTDQFYNRRDDIQFRIVAASGLNIFIGNGAIHYQFCTAQTSPKEDEIPHEFTMYRMDVELVGSDKNAQVIAEGKQGYYENYFTQATNGHSVKACAWEKITYKNIYPQY